MIGDGDDFDGQDGCLGQLLKHPTINDYYSKVASPSSYAALTFQLVLQAIAARTISAPIQIARGPNKINTPTSGVVNSGILYNGTGPSGVVNYGGINSGTGNYGVANSGAMNANVLTRTQSHPNTLGLQPTTHQPTTPKHYNVAMIKHPRFLSPSQSKNRVAEKVTEVIPVRDGQFIIYGKPKVRIGDGDCVVHNGPCQGEGYAKYTTNIQSSNQIGYPHDQGQEVEQSPQNQQSYLSPKNKAKRKQQMQMKMKNPKGSSAPYFPGTSQSIPLQSQRNSHRKHCRQNYEKVESRIKFLIDKDKKSKKLEKKVNEQGEILKRIQERQNDLLKKQNAQKEQQWYRNFTNRNQQKEVENDQKDEKQDANALRVSQILKTIQNRASKLKLLSKHTFQLSSSSQQSSRSSSSSQIPRVPTKPTVNRVAAMKPGPKISIELPFFNVLGQGKGKGEAKKGKHEQGHQHDENCSCQDDSELDSGNFGKLLKV